MQNVIETDALCKTYDSHRVVDHLTLTVPDLRTVADAQPLAWRGEVRGLTEGHASCSALTGW